MIKLDKKTIKITIHEKGDILICKHITIDPIPIIQQLGINCYECKVSFTIEVRKNE